MDANSTSQLRLSVDKGRAGSPPHVLHREEQRVSLRAFLRNFLQNENIANSAAMADFLTLEETTLTDEDWDDVRRRVEMDEKRMQEQRRFYEIAKARARELDVHMEKFRRDIVERSKLLVDAVQQSIDNTDLYDRWPHEAFPRDQAEEHDPGIGSRVSEVRGVATDRVSNSSSQFANTSC